MIGQLKSLGQAVLRTFKFSGLFNADVIVDHVGKIWLLEINARWSSSMELIERSLDLSPTIDKERTLLGCAINGELVGHTANLSNQADRIFLKRIIYARQRQRFCAQDFVRHLERNQSIHDIPTEGDWIQRGEPVLTVLTELDRQRVNSLKSYRRLRRIIS